MNNIIVLQAINIKSNDKQQIVNTYQTTPIYILDNPKTPLWSYIEYLHEECHIENKILSHLRICNEIKFNNNVTLLDTHDLSVVKPTTMSQLLKSLKEETNYHVIIENNDRSLLADIMQQLIYIDYPVTQINIQLRKEYKDAEKSLRFMKKIDELNRAISSVQKSIGALSIDADEKASQDLYHILEETTSSYAQIKEQIDKACSVEMKVAVAASKKTGKSVLVNCMIGDELAPTSLELATPNSCIYNRSTDGKYHLTYKGKRESFSDPKELYHKIHKEFKKAQQDAANGFTIPDMEISYVGNGNNFENYKIYDTPGPDFAGADHDESAKQAIQICDVAIFMIDYSKYLTTNEEEYLKKIKQVFEEKGKFHTLIFTLNKMDLALNDKGTKSRIKSIDFIRCRLKEISSQYSDCIVFATSAQNYFYTQELQKEAQNVPECQKLLEPGCDLYRELRPVKDDLSDSVSEKLSELLDCLDSEVSKIHRFWNPPTTIDTVQKSSGIPQLMSYISYVIKSKAREEIVNNITYTIDSQYRNIQTIIDQISNLETVIEKNEDEIDKISNILKEYEEKIHQALNNDLTEEDIDCIDPDDYLSICVDDILINEQKTFPIKVNDILKHERKKDRSFPSINEKIWEKIFAAQKQKLLLNRDKIVELKNLSLPQNDVDRLVNGFIQSQWEERLNREKDDVESLSDSITSIINARYDVINLLTENCKKELEKLDCDLKFPEISNFDFDFPIEDYRIDNLEIDDIRFNLYQLSSFYEGVGWFKRFFEKIFHGKSGLVKVQWRSDLEFSNILQQSKPDIMEAIDRSGIQKKMDQYAKELTLLIEETQKSIMSEFSRENKSCLKQVKTFMKVLDDRKVYQENLNSLKQKKEFVEKIHFLSKDFLSVWNDIIKE